MIERGWDHLKISATPLGIALLQRLAKTRTKVTHPETILTPGIKWRKGPLPIAPQRP